MAKPQTENIHDTHEFIRNYKKKYQQESEPNKNKGKRLEQAFHKRYPNG